MGLVLDTEAALLKGGAVGGWLLARIAGRWASERRVLTITDNSLPLQAVVLLYFIFLIPWHSFFFSAMLSCGKSLMASPDYGLEPCKWAEIAPGVALRQDIWGFCCGQERLFLRF